MTARAAARTLDRVTVVVDRALCLRRYPWSESSLVVHVFAREHGRVHLLARGAYRPTSRYYAVLDLFDELELEWDHVPSRELSNLRAGTLVTRRRLITTELERFTAAGTVLELSDLAVHPGGHDARLFDTVSSALDELASADARSPDEVLVRFELAFLDHLGLAPALRTCASCGGAAPPVVRRPEERAAFSAGAGGRLCARCAEEARAAGRRVGTLPVRVLDDGRALAAPDARMRPPLPDARVLLVRDFVGRFLDYHLESRPRSHRAFLSVANRNAPEAAPADHEPARPRPHRETP